MCRKTFGVLIIALACLLPARAGRSDDATDNSSQRPPTLSERLEHFRDEILGEPRSKRKAERANAAQSDGSTSPDRPEFGSGSDDPNRANQPKPAQRGASQGAQGPNQAQNQQPTQAPNQGPTRERQFVDHNGQPVPPPPAPAPVNRRMPGTEPLTPRRVDVPVRPQDSPSPIGQTGPSDRRLRPVVAVPVPPTPTAAGTYDQPMSLEARLSAVRQAAPPKASAARPDSDLPAARVARLEKKADLVREAKDASAEAVPERSIKHSASENLLFSGQSPVLSVEAAGPRKIMIGREATFVVKVHNSGDAFANNVTVAVNIPDYAELVGSQASSGSVRPPAGNEHREPLEWKISRLDAHSRETLTVRLVPHKSIPLDLAVQWSCQPDVTQTLVEVQEPKLMMALAGPEEILFGKSKMYKLTISNPGNGDADNVLVTLQPVGRMTEVAASHRLGTIRAGESKSVEVELTARQSGTLTIRAQAFGDGGLRAEAAEQVLVRRAMLRVEAEAPKVKYAGTNSTYRIRVTNNGNATAQNVHVSALLPPDAKFISGDAGSRLEANHGKVNWTAGNLQPGADRVFEMQCSLQSAGDNVVQFNATADDDVSGAIASTTRVEAMADLKLEVRDPQGPVPVGEDAVYEVVIRNRGTKSAEGIELVVFFSEGLEATAVQGGGHEIGAGQVVFKPISMLQAGGESVFRVHAKADRSGTHVFRAEVVCQSLQSKLAAEQTTRFYGEDTFGETAQPTKPPKHIAFERRPLEGESEER